MTPVIPLCHINQPEDDAMQLGPLYNEWRELTDTVAVYIRLWPVTKTLDAMENYLRLRVQQIIADKPDDLRMYIGFDFGGGGFDCSWADFFNLERWQWARSLVKLCQKLSGQRPVPVILENRATDEFYAGAEFPAHQAEAAYAELKGLDVWFDLPIPLTPNLMVHVMSGLWLAVVAAWQPPWWKVFTPKWKIMAANNGCSDVSLDPGGRHYKNYLRQMEIFGEANTIERAFVARSGVLDSGQECFDPRHFWLGQAPGQERRLIRFLGKTHRNPLVISLEKNEVGPVATAMQKWYVKP